MSWQWFRAGDARVLECVFLECLNELVQRYCYSRHDSVRKEVDCWVEKVIQGFSLMLVSFTPSHCLWRECYIERFGRFCAAECSWICFWNWKYLQVHCLTSPLEISESFFSSSFVHVLRLSRLWIDVRERRRYYIVQPKSCSLSGTALKSFCSFLPMFSVSECFESKVVMKYVGYCVANNMNS